MRPYMFIIAVVVIVIIVSVIRIAIKSSSHHFECPNCGEHFQENFLKSFFTAHSLGGDYSVTCPKCGKTNMMKSFGGKN